MLSDFTDVVTDSACGSQINMLCHAAHPESRLCVCFGGVGGVINDKNTLSDVLFRDNTNFVFVFWDSREALVGK